jgi:hypothetical protein
VVELVDTQDLKSCGHCGCAGSSPAPGTKQERRSKMTSFLFTEFFKTLLALSKTFIVLVKVTVATFPFSKTIFSEKLQPEIFFFMTP